MDDTEKAIRAGLTEAEIAEAIREPMTIHLLSAVDIVGTIATLRAELAARTEELADCRDAHEMTRRRENRTREERTEARRRVDERTEEVRLARYYMGALLGIIESDEEQVSAALELLGCADRDALLTEAQAFVSAP